jgi:hypothetical protein
MTVTAKKSSEQKTLTPDEVEEALRTGAPLDKGDRVSWLDRRGGITNMSVGSYLRWIGLRA